MKRFLVIVSIVLIAVACKTPQERAGEKLQAISDAAKQGDIEEVKERVEDMTIWYEGLSFDDKKQVDRAYNKLLYELTMAQTEAQKRADEMEARESEQEKY